MKASSIIDNLTNINSLRLYLSLTRVGSCLGLITLSAYVVVGPKLSHMPTHSIPNNESLACV